MCDGFELSYDLSGEVLRLWWNGIGLMSGRVALDTLVAVCGLVNRGINCGSVGMAVNRQQFPQSNEWVSFLRKFECMRTFNERA